MATTVGEIILSDEMIVAQSDEIATGTMVESLVIEFDQEKHEEFLSSDASSPSTSRKCRGVYREHRAQTMEAPKT